jgi:triosephosphate isomerase
VAAKYEAIQKGGLIPVLCIGETLAQFEAGTTNQVVETQLKAVIDRCGIASFENAVIAYEPVWAIGTGKTATRRSHNPCMLTSVNTWPVLMQPWLPRYRSCTAAP